MIHKIYKNQISIYVVNILYFLSLKLLLNILNTTIQFTVSCSIHGTWCWIQETKFLIFLIGAISLFLFNKLLLLQICEMLQNGGTYYWNEEMKVPYCVQENQWVGFDDEKSIRNKMKWIKENGFAGAMVWTIDMDDFSGTVCGGGIKYPLIGAMRWDRKPHTFTF